MRKPVLILAAALLLLGIPGRARALNLVIASDTTWRAIGPVGNLEGQVITNVGLAWESNNVGWNSSLSYPEPNAPGGIPWRNALYIDHSAAFTNPITGSQTIWYDGTGSNGSTPSYFRKVFNLSGTPSSAILEFGVDDDAQVYLNGSQIINDHNGSTDLWYIGNGRALDVMSLLHQGDNLIAVKAQDSFGFREWIVAKLQVNVVPEPSTLGLLAVGAISLLAFACRRWAYRRKRA